MKKVIFTLGLIAMFLISANNLSAQKFGYINSIELLSELPEISTADDAITSYQNGLVEKGQTMVKTFETNYQKYIEDYQNGVLSALQQQQKEGELAMEQQKIQEYEYEVQTLVTKKREEMYAPILEKVRVTIEQVGKEEGYTMIFDSSVGGILSAEEGDNVLALVKSKLGI